MKKKTKLIKLFFNCLYIGALSIPIFTLLGTFLFNYLAPISYFGSHKSNNESTYSINYVYESNDVDTINDLRVNHVYHLDTFDIQSNLITGVGHETDEELIFCVLACESINALTDGPFIDEIYIDNYVGSVDNLIQFTLRYESLDDFWRVGICFFSNANAYVSVEDLYYDTLSFTNVDFVLQDSQTLSLFKEFYLGTLPSRSDFNVIEGVDIDNNEDFEHLNNYPLKSFDDACFYTLNSLGAFDHSFDVDIVDLQQYLKLITDDENIYSFGDVKGDGFDFTDVVYVTTGVVNYDWISLFDFAVQPSRSYAVDFALNGNDGCAYVFLNYYINYLINTSLLILLPQVILCFFGMAQNFIYRFLDEGDR